MTDYTIVLGNKSYSSWSLRGWLPLVQCGLDFGEIVIPLRRPETAAEIRRHCPSARVPTLIVEENGRREVVWDSLAIGEWLAERFPAAGLWPADPTARARARAVTAEMHSGFTALRSNLPMDLRGDMAAHGEALRAAPGVAEDVERIEAIWTDCRATFGIPGDFLFGDYSIADIAFTPVASRFKTYGVPLAGTAASYAEALLDWPAMRRWTEEASAEPWVIEFPELDPRS